MSAVRGSAEGITVPAGDPEALRRSSKQLAAVHHRMSDASLRLGSTPSFMSGWFGPGSSAFADFTGQQASTLSSRALSVGVAADTARSVADELAEAQAKAWRAIERALEAREEIDRALAIIEEARGEQRAARERMALAAAARDAVRSEALGAVVDVMAGGGASAALMEAADEADRQYRAAEQELHEAERRERQARDRLEHARDDLERAREDGREAELDAQGSAESLRVFLDAARDDALLAPGGAPYGAAAAAAAGSLPPPPTPRKPAALSEREPPESWPGWAKAWFKVGRGEATALQGLWNTGRSAVEHPDRVPGAVWDLGQDTVNDPVGTGKSLIGYDELAAGRWEDWTGQMGAGLLAGGGVGTGAARASRLRRVRGDPRIEPLGQRPTPINSRQFAGGRVDFSRPDLGRRDGTSEPKIDAARRAELAHQFPNGVRFTRAGYPVLTPYATERVSLHGLTGDNRIDEPRANAEAGLPSTPKGYTWHHVEDGRGMELVPRPLHETLKHTGGAAAIKADQLGQVAPGGSFNPFERGLTGGGALGGAGAGGAAGPPPPTGSGP